MKLSRNLTFSLCFLVNKLIYVTQPLGGFFFGFFVSFFNVCYFLCGATGVSEVL